MVPKCKEPLYSCLLDFIHQKRITFAALSFDTTSEFGAANRLVGYKKQKQNGNN
jgi:hypothetical protein